MEGFKELTQEFMRTVRNKDYEDFQYHLLLPNIPFFNNLNLLKKKLESQKNENLRLYYSLMLLKSSDENKKLE